MSNEPNFYCHTKTFEEAASQPGFANVCIIHGYRFKFYEGDPLRGIHIVGSESRKLILDDRLPKGYLFKATDPLVIGLTGTDEQKREALKRLSGSVSDAVARDSKNMITVMVFLGYISKIWPRMEMNGLTIQEAFTSMREFLELDEAQVEAMLQSHAAANGPVPAMKQ